MKRRDFLKKSIRYGITTATGLSLFPKGNLLARDIVAPPGLVGIQGGNAPAMFDRGIAAMGGIKRFVKPGQTVTVKPNIGWDTRPERGADTNPGLVERIIRHCMDAGARKVYVFDHTADIWQNCYKRSGIASAVKNSGGIMAPGNSHRNYHEITVSKGKRLKRVKAHELFLETDVFINVPVLKDHGSTRLTIGMKNLMGVVWDRGYWHASGLHQCIADFATIRKPDLTVIDAYRVMKRNGPMGVSPEDTILMKAQILSVDPVAGDAAAAKMFGIDPQEIDYISIAHNMSTGTMDLSQINIKRIRM